MIQDYSELLKRYSDKSSRGEATDMGGDMAFAIRALVAENERFESALKTIVELPISDGSQDDMLAASMRTIARAALGETE
jgi:hypothetical protein